MSIRSSIYERVISHCPPYGVRGGWCGLDADPDCRCAPPWGTSLLSLLSEEFLENQLVDAGVAKPLEDGLVLVAALQDQQAVIALRESPDAPPYALLTGSGLLMAEGFPAVYTLPDWHTQMLIDHESPCMLVAFPSTTSSSCAV